MSAQKIWQEKLKIAATINAAIKEVKEAKQQYMEQATRSKGKDRAFWRERAAYCNGEIAAYEMVYRLIVKVESQGDR